MKEINVTEKSVRVPGLSARFLIYHTADLHLTGMEETQPAPRRKEAERRGQTVFSAEVPAEERLQNHLQKAETRGADLVILGGDILDTPSWVNFEALRRAWRSSKVPILYHVGNHDWSYSDSYQCLAYEKEEYPRFAEFVAGEGNTPDFQILEYPCFRILAVDNGRERFSDSILEKTKKALADGKPTLISMHIPLYADTLTAPTVQVWHRDITLGGACGITKDGNTAAFEALVTDAHSPVLALFAGHLHFAHDDSVAGRLPQYTVGAGYEGFANLYCLTGEEQETVNSEQ